MGAIECPHCHAVINQEGQVIRSFFNRLIRGVHTRIEGLRGAVASHNPAKADKELAWDGDAAKTALQKWASSDGSGDKDKISWSKYRTGFAWYDEEKPEELGSYKLPHHTIIDGELKTVWSGVVAAMAALNGARTEVDIPEGDRIGVYNHLSAHYHQFEEEPPELK